MAEVGRCEEKAEWTIGKDHVTPKLETSLVEI
jgi:hypothetical protein